jgi:subtilisin-like proprotein convertase family protein
MAHRRFSVPAVLAAATLVALSAPTWAAGAIVVDHDSVTATETTPGGDGVIGPGDTFSLIETLHTSTFPGLTGVSGTLTSSTPGVQVTQGASRWPNLAFGTPAANAPAFGGSLAASADCGVSMNFSVHLHADQGDADVPFTVPTGFAGPFRPFTSVDVPKLINDNASVTSSFGIASPGRVKGVRVRIDRINHTYVGDLLIELIAPDGTAVKLFDGAPDNAGRNFVNTVFDSSAPTSISAASAPYTGTFAPAESLRKLNGTQQQGTWKLKVTDRRSPDTGTLESWGADVSSAVCSGNPVASFVATPNPVPPGASVVLDASGSVAPLGSITKYEWDLDNDGRFEIDNGANAKLTTSFPVRGRRTVRLRVTDNAAHTDVVSGDISVTRPPTASFTATPGTAATGQPVRFDASGSSDPDGPIARYEWDLDGNGTFETDGGTSPTINRAYSAPGDVAVHLRVTDQDGATDIATRTVRITNRAPIASFVPPAPAVVGQPGTFDASGSSDPDGRVVDYAWDFDGDGTYETPGGASPTISKVFALAGTYVVGLRVTDNDGATATTTRTVRVGLAPLAALVVMPSSALTGQTVTFDASGSRDPDGTIVGYEWDLDGNGAFETSTGATPSVARSYANRGVVQVRVRVTDNDGARGIASAMLTVSDPPPVTPPGGATPGSGGGTGGVGTPGGASTAGRGAPGGGTGGGAGVEGSGGGGSAALGPLRAELDGPAVQKARDVAKGGLQVACVTDRPATCALQAEVSAVDAKRLGLKAPRGKRGKGAPAAVTVGSASVSSDAGRSTVVSVELSAAARKRMARRGGVTVTVRGAVTATGGGVASVVRAVLVR